MGFLNKCFGGCGSTSKKQPSTTIEDLCHRFSLSQLRKSTDGFDKSRIISKGGSSVVYRASISINGQLKDLALERFKQQVVDSRFSWCKKNIIYRCLVRHPNVVSLVGFCDDGNELIVAYDYAPNGFLRDQLNGIERNSPTLSWKRRLEISIGVIELICGKRLYDIAMQLGGIKKLGNLAETLAKENGNLAETGNAKEFVDERLVGEIAAGCLKLYMEIAKSCLSEDPKERPDMGDVELQLEHVLQLQEVADANRACLI